MSQAEELLNGMPEEVPVHTHPVPDADTYYVIDPVTRKIENTNPKKHVIMQYDHNSERFTFELPRYIDGHDMLECTSVTVNVDNIEAVESEGVEEAEPVEPRANSDAPDITDLRVHPDDSEKVICSWLISRNSTQLAGILSFHVEFKCVDSSGNVVYEWSTDNFDEIEVRARKKNGESAVAEHTDLLEQWRTRIFGAGDSVMANIAAEGETQIAAVKAESETQQEAVELKGVQTLDSIPEDYTEVDAMAEEAVRTKSNAIVCEASGESIVLKDSSNDHIRGLKLFGKSIQDGTPTPDNPVEITSVDNASVIISGKNLLPNTANTQTKNGVTFTINKDGSVTLNGTASAATDLRINPGVAPDLTGFDVVLTGGISNKIFFEVTDNANSQSSHVDLGNGVRFDGYRNTCIYVRIAANTVCNNVTVYPMIRSASIADSTYEPYRLAQSIALNHTLSGIPVTSGGNYTDSDGQQWICDEVDLERGVYVQRIKKFILSALKTDTWRTWGVSKNTDGITGFYHYVTDSVILDFVLCNIGVYGSQTWGGVKSGVGASAGSKYLTVSLNNECLADVSSDEKAIESLQTLLSETNATMLAAIEPIETPLTAEEITAFKALRTNYPNTTILNDAGAWMSVKYNADTKSYVDKPKTLRLTDTSTGVVYELKIVDGALTVVPVQ
jgi:hypothetical protein